MPTLTMGQYELVYAMLSLTIASMGAAAIFFFLGRQSVGEKYRPALLVSGLVVTIACYHYVRIFYSWQDAFTLTDGLYVASGVPFLDSYRYADWLLTVPLLVVELVAVLALAKAKSRSLITKLSVAAVLMIAAGYPGEIATDAMTKHIWGIASSVPFAYILYTLFVELNKAVERQPDDVKVLVRNIRLLLLGTWGVYPIAYLVGTLGMLNGAVAEVGLQLGYSLADITAKAGFGLMIYAIARAKTAADAREQQEDTAAVPAAVAEPLPAE